MALASLARRLESVSALVSSGGRTLLSLDTNPVPGEWDHITKVDPEGEKKLPLLFPLYLSHTSAVSVGGSRDVTDQNTEETFDLMTAAEVTAFHEPSAARHVTESTREQADLLAIPEVLNGDSESLVGTLGEGIDYVRTELAPALVEEKFDMDLDGAFGSRVADFAAAWMMEQEAVFEAYIIMNLDSAAAREANVTEDDLLTPTEARQRALAAEYHLESEIIYLEYSGTFGGDEAVEILEEIDDATRWPRIWYGGGLDNREDAERVLDAGADAAIVGDTFHDIAEEEAALFERAREEFDGTPDSATVREWVADQVDIAETSAARYLSTIPHVPRPEDRALGYLVGGIRLALALAERAGELDDPDVATLREALADDVPGESAFADVIDDAPDEFAQTLALTLLAERFEVNVEETFTAEHLHISL